MNDLAIHFFAVELAERRDLIERANPGGDRHPLNYELLGSAEEVQRKDFAAEGRDWFGDLDA
jgi:hypothetical protein